MNAPMFTQRAVKTVTVPPFMQTHWAKGTRTAQITAVTVYSLWASWCILWAVLWAFSGPLGVVLTPLSLTALVLPFRSTRRRIHGYISAPLE